MWRWCFFGAGLAPVWYLSGVIVDGCLFALEAKLFTIQQAFYFVVAMKVGAQHPSHLLTHRQGSVPGTLLCPSQPGVHHVQRPGTMLLRMLLLIPLYVVAFADGIARPEDVQLAYTLVLKSLICLTLFAAGNVLKTLLAKLLASHFHRRAFFDKLQDALQKVSLT